MRVHVVPGRLRLATSLLALTLPLTALHVLLVTRAPWWKIPYRTVQLWCLSTALMVAPIAVWILQGRRWARSALLAFGGIWTIVATVGALKQGSPSLALFAVGIAAYFWGLTAWIRWESGRSFFDPGLRWYLGRPPVIPGLACEVLGDDSPARLRVARLDGEGAFVFAEPGATFRLRPQNEAEMIFTYRDAQVRCRGIAVRSVDEQRGGGAGAGFQFARMSADARKELGDFVEGLRGEGHG